jgi:hypothetical protein
LNNSLYHEQPQMLPLKLEVCLKINCDLFSQNVTKKLLYRTKFLPLVEGPFVTTFSVPFIPYLQQLVSSILQELFGKQVKSNSGKWCLHYSSTSPFAQFNSLLEIQFSQAKVSIEYYHFLH